jgi:hypothetical protein
MQTAHKRYHHDQLAHIEFLIEKNIKEYDFGQIEDDYYFEASDYYRDELKRIKNILNIQ